MQHVLDELQRATKYHLRQLEENVQKIKNSEELIADLKQRNFKHMEAIKEFNRFIESIKQAEE